MFYSETLLSKTGPLARVWLSANLERKLSKSHILQSNIESSVNAIVDQGQAPMALRLSGQLLLGVVRIYSRKARYLLDDCNEALMKIKMAFRTSSNNTLPTELHIPNAQAITLPDVLTGFEDNIMPPLPEELGFLNDQSDFAQEETTVFDWSTQELPESMVREQEHGRNILDDDGPTFGDDLELDLDIGDDSLPEGETSIHVGRDAPAPRPLEEEILSDDKQLEDNALGLDLGEDVPMSDPPQLATSPNPAEHEDIEEFMGGHQLPLEDGSTVLRAGGTPPEEREKTPSLLSPRSSESVLSSARSSVDREIESNFAGFHDEDDVSVEEAAGRVKRRRLVQPDFDTVLHGREIRDLIAHRKQIIRPISLLPKDPLLLSLVEMQKSGGFVSSVLGERRLQGWAPELRDLLSVEAIKRCGELKRKRDNGMADVEQSILDKMPRLEIDEEDFGPAEEDIAFGDNTTIGEPSEMIELPADDGLGFPPEEDMIASPGASDVGGIDVGDDTFDVTVAPLVHPADSGPVSLGTKHAVHLLRDTFSKLAASESPSRASKISTTFQDLLPTDQTTKSDATKMFFEILVLATKDAIKMEQTTDECGGPIRLRGKRGLWGAWAEMGAGGEISLQMTQGKPSEDTPA